MNQCSTNCSLLRESPAALSCAENGAALPDTELSPIEYSTLNTGESPQRRRRVYAVADTRGGRADELLFEQAGAEWHFDPRVPERETVAGLAPDCYQWHDRMVGAADGVNEPQGAYTLKIRSGCDGGGKGALVQKDLSATLVTHQDQTLFVRRSTDED